MVKATAKAAGQTEPTADEKDPAFLALQIRALNQSVENMEKAFNENMEAMKKAFSMVDVHQQILMRITREVAKVAVVSGSAGTGPLKLTKNFDLDLPAYYQEYRDVAAGAGPEASDYACVMWSQGMGPEEAIAAAQQQLASEETNEEAADLDYEVEYFGGTNGKDRNQQIETGTQTVG